MTDRLQFLKEVAPFKLLPEDVLIWVADLLQEVTHKKEAVIYQQEVTPMNGIDIIFRGEYESFFYDSAQTKRMVETHERGYCYGGISLLVNKKKSLRTTIAKKGTTIYFFPAKEFLDLCKAYKSFFQFFTDAFGQRMLDDEFVHFFKRPASFEESYIASDQLYSRKIESIKYRPVVSCTAETPAYEAATIMAANKVSCLFVKDNTDNLIGYVTDITLRDNVIAKQSDTAIAIHHVIANPIISVDLETYVYEALLLMFRTNTRYLLVKRDDEVVGFISRNRLLSEQAESPLIFIQSVKLALSDAELKRKWQMVPDIVSQLLVRGINAEIVNQVITTVADTIAIKIIEEVINELGEPPAKFVFMVLGSEGRKEQTLKTDQDNAIIYEDKANERREEVREYFLKFAEIVSQRLNFVGFSYCTGGFMASNPEWTHSLSYWKKNYERWMQESLPESVIKFSTFFDCRHLYGEAQILEELKSFLDEELHKPNEKLFFFMARNALQYEPPLTYFKNIRTFTVGKQEVFDVKKAMTPIVDLIRVYSLKNHVFEVNTGERLKALTKKGIFSDTAFMELLQSYYFLMSLRLKKQATQITQDKAEPDNFIDIASLSKIEQGTLKEIFKTIQSFQSRIKIEFTDNLLG